MPSTFSFDTLDLNPKILRSVTELGYENATPIQAECIPALLEGEDLVAQAETGSGKTAAFALPILNQLDTSKREPQALIITPTRELAIQVAEAFQRYGKYLNDIHVLPIYGGQDYRIQLRGLKRGAHIIVGTPGRIMDHIRRETLVLNELTHLVLDEADEMLKMGFQEDIEWIFEQIPTVPQKALFSATIPQFIHKVIKRYLENPKKIHIQSKPTTAPKITQQYALIFQEYKLDALTRFLEIETFDAVIIFTRTKNTTLELAEKLQARGHRTAALNGDIKQSHREKVIEHLKNGRTDIVIATDVAARGLDVSRISYVINYDIPYDVESYVHRIGRTGRAGRTGKALLLVTPREQRMLRDIEKTTKMQIEQITPPTLKTIYKKRDDDFSSVIIEAIENKPLDEEINIIKHLSENTEYSTLDIAAALVSLLKKPSNHLGEKKDDVWTHDFSKKPKSTKPKRRTSYDAKKHYEERGRKPHKKHEEKHVRRSKPKPKPRRS